MYKSILLFLFSVSVLYARADQQTILNKAEAEKTVAFLETQDEIILYCGCCDNDTYSKVTISEVSYECESSSWCKVRVQGVNVSTQDKVNKTIDLAYVWVNVDGVAKNLAWEMGLNADPCTPQFEWENYRPVTEPFIGTFDESDSEIFQSSFKDLKKLLESETDFSLETFESNEEFEVQKVTLTAIPSLRSIVVCQIGERIEHRYTIPLNKIESLTKNTEGIEFDTKEDGLVMVEELVDSEVKYRAFYLICTVPFPNVGMPHLRNFGMLVKTNASMER